MLEDQIEPIGRENDYSGRSLRLVESAPDLIYWNLCFRRGVRGSTIADSYESDMNSELTKPLANVHATGGAGAMRQ